MNTTSGKPKSISIDLIRTDGGTQSREEIDRAVVEDYSRSIADLPPVVVFFDDTDYWLSDGFHRLEAHLMANAEYIDCDVREGSVRDAILHSVSANARHGVRRTNADKRKAVLTMLADEEWRKWSDGKIADQCGVSQPFVGSVRGELTQNRYESERTYTTRHGTTATMNVANIGTNKAPAVAPTFGDINTDDEPTAADDDNARPEPDEDEIERKAANKRFIENAPFMAAAEAESLGKTPQQESEDDPGRRWTSSMHKLYVFMNSTRDNGGIKALAESWSRKTKKEYADELRRITAEIQKWIATIEE